MNSLVVVGIIALLVVIAAALMALWIADARRADRVAHDEERQEQGPAGDSGDYHQAP